MTEQPQPPAERFPACIESSREVKTCDSLQMANWLFLEEAKREEKGRSYKSLATILMAAFKFEAYLNHAGQQVDSDWNEWDNNGHPTWQDKLNRLAGKLQLTFEKGRRPLQTITELFKFRDSLVHGKTERVSETKKFKAATRRDLIEAPLPVTQWEKLCTLDFANRTWEDTEKMIAQISKAFASDPVDL